MFTSSLTRYINICKIPNFLLYCQFLNPELVLDYNTTNFLDLPSDNNNKNISPKVSNYDKEKIRLTNIDRNKDDIRLTDIGKQRPATLIDT